MLFGSKMSAKIDSLQLEISRLRNDVSINKAIFEKEKIDREIRQLRGDMEELFMLINDKIKRIETELPRVIMLLEKQSERLDELDRNNFFCT